MGKHKIDRDAVVRESFDRMFEEHSGDQLLEMQEDEESDLPEGMHIIEIVSLTEFLRRK